MCFLILAALAFFIESKLCAFFFHRPEPVLMKKSDEDDDDQCYSSSETRENVEEISIAVKDTDQGRAFIENRAVFQLA